MSGSYTISTNSTTNSTKDTPHVCEGQWVALGTYTALELFTSLFGFPACVAVLWHLFQKLRTETSVTPNDVFMLNLTAMDLLFVGLLPAGVTMLWCNTQYTDTFSTFLFSLTLTGRPLFMTCICADCYLAVVHPITYRARKGLTSRVLVSVAIWVITLVYGGLYCAKSRIMKIIMYYLGLLPYVVTILTIGICDFFILRALKSSDPGGRDLHPQKKRALQIIVNSLVMTFVFYSPQLLTFILWLICDCMSRELNCVMYIIGQTFATTGSAVMPILYLNNIGKLDWIWRWCHRTT